MITTDHNNMCAQARAHYYEYLDDELRACIPGEMAAHLDSCQTCQSEVNRLKGVLVTTEKDESKTVSETTPAILTNLKLHFAYLGTPVGCSAAKLFLPSMVVNALAVTVPTPITAHIGRCPQCSDDLAAIRRLNLSTKQLYRLGQLFADTPEENGVICEQALDAISDVGAVSSSKVDPEVLKHLCVCGDCRTKLYYHREAILKEVSSVGPTPEAYPCEGVLPTDIFDYCLPYGIDEADDQSGKARSTLTDHLQQCPDCLAKMQELHSIVCGILERHESGITTCFSFRDDEGTVASGTSYVSRGWDVDVRTSDEVGVEPEPAESIAVPIRTVSPQPRTLTFKKLAKPASVAAAIVLAVVLLMNGPVARAVNLAQIYEALERVTNVHIAAFYQEETEPIQETWVSHDLNIRMLKAGQQFTLWDVDGKSVKIKDLSTNSITTSELDNDTSASVRTTMNAVLELLPFRNMSQAPPGAIWKNITGEETGTIVPQTEGYELLWTEKSTTGIVDKRWRGYIDINTKLPRRVEWSRKRNEDAEFKLLTTVQVDYPATAEIEAFMGQESF